MADIGTAASSTVSSGSTAAAISLGMLPAFEPIFIAYAALIVMAIVPIYYGSKLSIEEGKVLFYIIIIY